MVSSEENDKIRNEMNDDKILEYSPAIAYSAIVMVLGISGNIFSLTYYGFKSQRTPTNNLIACLAAIDLILCVVFSDEIIELCFTIAFKNVFGCKVMYFTNHTLVLSSSFILVLISVDRFQRICKRQSWHLTVTSAKLCTAALLFLAFLLSTRDFAILDVVQVNLTVPERNATITGYYCTHSRDVEKKASVTAFQLIDLLIFIIALLTMAVLYTFVARVIWIQRRKRETHMQFTSTKACASELDSGCVEGSSTVSTGATKSNNFREVADSETKGDSKEISITSPEEKTRSVNDHGEQQSKRKQADTVERKIAVMMIVITAVSILSFVPYFIVNLAMKRSNTPQQQEFSVGIQIALRSFMLNNAVNPYIMCLFNSQFKQFVKDTICKCRSFRVQGNDRECR